MWKTYKLCQLVNMISEWDLILTRPCFSCQNPTLFIKKVKEDQIAIGIAQKIILKDINNEIAIIIIDLEDVKEIWNKLTSICSKIGQKVVYSILQKFLNYLKINKFKKYNKPVIQIFIEVWYSCKCLYTTMTPSWGIWDIIAIVIILDTLKDNFDITTTSLQKNKDKTINQIKNIL